MTRDLVLRGPLGPQEVLPLCDHVHLILGDESSRVVMCDVGGVAAPDAATVEALARLQLAARRAGGEIRLLHATTDLIALIEFMGLSDVVRCGDSGVDTRREPE